MVQTYHKDCKVSSLLFYSPQVGPNWRAKRGNHFGFFNIHSVARSKKTISKKNQRLQKELVSFTFAIIRLKLFLMGFEPMRTHNATGPTYRNFLSKTLTNNRFCMNVGHLLDSCKKTSASSTRDSKKYEYFEHILIDLSIKRWIC